MRRLNPAFLLLLIPATLAAQGTLTVTVFDDHNGNGVRDAGERTIRGVVIGALRESPIVVVVDDASTDGTSQALSGLPARVVRHETNLGKAAALWTGFDVAMAEGADYVATLDGDGQHDPADLRRLVNAAARYPRAIVIGARLLDRASAPPSRRV